MPEHAVADKPCVHCGGDHRDPKDKIIADLLAALKRAVKAHPQHCQFPGSKINDDGTKNVIWCAFAEDVAPVIAAAEAAL